MEAPRQNRGGGGKRKRVFGGNLNGKVESFQNR